MTQEKILSSLNLVGKLTIHTSWISNIVVVSGSIKP